MSVKKEQKKIIYFPLIVFCFYIMFADTFCQGKNPLGCGDLIKSTCHDNITTKWNHKNISNILKEWIESIERRQEFGKNDFNTGSPISKKVKKDYMTQNVQFIGNLDCSTKRTIGPIWKTPPNTVTRKSQFHNGFLYGLEDEKSRLTGKGSKPMKLFRLKKKSKLDSILFPFDIIFRNQCCVHIS